VFEQLPGNIDLGRQFEHPYLQVVLLQILNLVFRCEEILHFSWSLGSDHLGTL
jgi:hypothetical protein